MAIRSEDSGEASLTQRQRRYATSETLQQVLRVRERLMQESKGELFEDSAELLRKQREERTQYLEQLGGKSEHKHERAR